MGILGSGYFSFNTQPRGGGCVTYSILPADGRVFQHTAARRRLPFYKIYLIIQQEFQHTAARRRLHYRYNEMPQREIVSTHSRAEAAAIQMHVLVHRLKFQHTAARRRLPDDTSFLDKR